MKPITYWVQNDAIKTLMEEYGEYLEEMTADDRRHLLAYLANADHYWSSEESEADRGYRMAKDLTRHEKDLLMAAIATNLLEQESPWLKGAIEMIAIEKAHKKAGTPSHEDAHAD